MAKTTWPRELVSRVALEEDPRGNALSIVSVHLPVHRALVRSALLLQDDQLTMALLSTAFEPPSSAGGPWILVFRSLAQPTWRGEIARSTIRAAHRRIVAEEALKALATGTELVVSDYRDYTGPDAAIADGLYD